MERWISVTPSCSAESSSFSCPPWKKPPPNSPARQNQPFGYSQRCSVGLGANIEGDAADVLEALPTDTVGIGPYLCVVDEYAAIVTPGFEVVLTQGRGLGIAAIVASQDYAGILEADKKGAQQMVANTSIKIFMKMQDAEKTWELIRGQAGQSTVLRTTGFNVNEQLSSGYRDANTTTVEQEDRVVCETCRSRSRAKPTLSFPGRLSGVTFFSPIPLSKRRNCACRSCSNSIWRRLMVMPRKWRVFPMPHAYYRNTLYGRLNSSPRRLAIFVEIGRFPFSISEMAFWLTPRRAASSACVRSSLPRKPRKAIAGQPSGKTSSALTISSPSELTGAPCARPEKGLREWPRQPLWCLPKGR